jgi:excisionase family DNA binding protein
MEPPFPWLTQAEACQHARIGRSTLWKLCKSGALRARKLGARILISRAELDALIEKRSAAPSAIAQGGDR